MCRMKLVGNAWQHDSPSPSCFISAGLSIRKGLALAADPPIQEGLTGEMVEVQLVGQCTASIHGSDKREVLDVCVVGRLWEG